MTRCRVEQDELDNDPPDRIESLYDECEEVEPLGRDPHRNKHTGKISTNPGMDGYQVREDQFQIISDFRRDEK